MQEMYRRETTADWDAGDDCGRPITLLSLIILLSVLFVYKPKVAH